MVSLAKAPKPLPPPMPAGDKPGGGKHGRE
jgi:hypothetical protein